MKSAVAFFSLIFIFSNVFPQEFSDAPRMPIASFEIDGLKRTKERYMENLFSHFKGREASDETKSQIEGALQEENLFEEIAISFEENSEGETVARISLKEKWSFLPLPFVAASNGSFMAGLFLIDMNAFGIHDTFVGGGLYSKDMLMGMGAYVKSPHKKGDFGFSISFSLANRESTFCNGSEKNVLEYDALSLGVSARLVFKPTSHTSVNFETAYNFFNPEDAKENFAVRKTHGWKLGAGWDFSKSSWNGIFLSSNGVSISGGIYFSDNSDFKIGESISASAKAQLPVAQKIRLLGAASLFFGNDLFYPQWQSRTMAGISVLPSDFRTLRIFGVSSGAEFCIVKIKFGMLSAYALYQVALAQDWNKSLYFAHGPEAGIRVYFAKIAIPAISMGGSYNVTNNSWQYSFSFGMGF